MPIHVAGPRLYSSVGFKHLVKGAGAGASRSSNVSINLTPFVDMMTILVTFLLIVFSADGELFQVQKGLELPTVASDKASQLQAAPVIIVTGTEISYLAQRVATVDEVIADTRPGAKIDELFKRLTATGETIKKEIAAKKDKDGNPLDEKLLKACAEAKVGQRPQKDAEGRMTICPESLAILTADENVDAIVINRIVYTAKAAGFDNLLFAVKKK